MANLVIAARYSRGSIFQSRAMLRKSSAKAGVRSNRRKLKGGKLARADRWELPGHFGPLQPCCNLRVASILSNPTSAFSRASRPHTKADWKDPQRGVVGFQADETALSAAE